MCIYRLYIYISTALHKHIHTQQMSLRQFRRRSPPHLRRFSTTKPKLPLLNPPTTASATSATSTVHLFSWGCGSSGQLGSGAEQTRLYPSPVASLLLPPSLQTPVSGRVALSPQPVVSCGLFHSAVMVEGKVWVWGKGDGGRLGLGDEDSLFVPTLNENLESVVSVALGGLHSVALDTLGRVFTWGYGGFGALGHSVYHRELVPRMVKGSWDGKIGHIATSGTHTAAITESGEVYTWGRDEGDGRLGLGPERGPDQAGGLSVPSKVKALTEPMAAVSCGGFFTMAVTKEGQLWNWGANSNYELGRGDKFGGWRPKPIPILENVRIIQIASGGYHSLALTDEGNVLSWGHGGHGQLGHSSTESQKIPVQIASLADKKIVYIACGGSSSAAVTDDGQLYMWGVSKDSQLGVPGLPQIQPSPVEVKLLMEDDELGTPHVFAVAIGASHAMCLASRSTCNTPS